MTSSSDEPVGRTAEAFAEKVFSAYLGSQETLGYYVGDRLGWYAALAEGPATAPELAGRTRTHLRYVREWLEMQAAYGVLDVDDVTRGPDERRFTLPPGAREVLTDEHSLSYLGALPRLTGAVGRVVDQLLEVYRTGGGVGWAALGPDAYESQAALNRPWFDRRLGAALAAVPDLHALLATDGARILDVGCGGGWSTQALAAAYPTARVLGIDIDEPSIDLARANLDRAHPNGAALVGEADGRVEFRRADAADLGADTVDAAFLFECVHDLARPVEVLAAVRSAVRTGAAVVVMDEAVGDAFTAPADEVDRLMYGFSLFVCLPDGLSSEPSEGTGTVMRRSVLTDYARRAGYRSVEVLPIEDFSLFRFYRLHG